MNKTYFLVIDGDCTPALYPAEQCTCKPPAMPVPPIGTIPCNCPPIIEPVPPIGILPTGTVRTNGSNLNLRKEPSLDAEVIARMPNRTNVTILDTDTNGWHKVAFQGMTGYAASQWIEMQ